jgi:hypothetical protein
MKFSREVMPMKVGDLNAILFKSITSTIPKWQLFKLLKYMQNLIQSVWYHEIVYANRSSKD